MADTLTTDELAAIRVWIGTDETDDSLNARYLRLGNLNGIVTEVLNVQLTDLLNNPESFTTPDGTQVSFRTNITALQARIKSFREQGGLSVSTSGSPPRVTKLVRPDLR